MPDVGVLNLTIHDNSETAGEGLQSLAGALERIKQAMPGNGLGLSSVGKELNSFAQQLEKIKSSMSVFKTITEFGNEMKNLSETMNAANAGFDASKIVSSLTSLKDAVGEGINLGDVGTQIKELREAVSGEWKTDGITNAATAIDSIGKATQSFSGNNAATVIKDIAAALNEYATVVSQVSSASSGAHDLYTQMANMGGSGASASGGGKSVISTEQFDQIKTAVEGLSDDIPTKISQIAEALSKLDSLSGGVSLKEYASGLKSIASSIESGANSYLTLGRLATSMEKVKAAGVGFKVPDFSRIESLARALQDNFNAENGLKRIAEGMEAIKKASEGFKMPNMSSLEKIMDASSGTSMLQATTGDIQKDIQNAYSPIKSAVGSTLKEFEHLENNGGFRSYMYGPRNDIEYDNTTGFQKGYETDEERMEKNPQWYQPEEFYQRIAQAAQEAQAPVESLKTTIQQTQESTGNEDAQWIDNLVNNASQVDLLNMKLESMTDRLYEGATSGSMTGEQMASLVSQIQSTKDKIDELTESATKHIDIVGALKSAYQNLKSGIENMFPTLTGLLKRFSSMAKMRAMRYIIREITSGFKEGVEHVYEYSKAMGTGFAPALDSAKSSLATMKNAIGAAAAPLLQSLVPVLQTVVNWFITVVNYANQFFSLLRGQRTWTKATPQTVSAFDKQTKAAKGASAAIKDLLADWDELNIIQQQGGSSGSGAGTTAAEDYLSMFQEVSEFDNRIEGIVGFIQDNMSNILNLIKDAGIAFLAWRFSDAFLGNLDWLGGILKLGVLAKISFDATVLWDEAFIKSNGESWGSVMANVVTTAITTAVAGVIGKAAFKKLPGGGQIASSIMLAISAGVDFAEATKANILEQTATGKVLNIMGVLKSAIGAALATAGFIATGAAFLPALVAGVAVISIATLISYSIRMEAINEETAREFAYRTFSETGLGGTINYSEYAGALQDELDRRSAGASLVLNTYAQMPELKGKFNNAISQITSFNSIILRGNGKLTKKDAEAFKENWGIILETLNEMNTAQYDTILQGLTNALSSKNEELRRLARETRSIFIGLEQNISEEDATLFAEMEEIKDNLIDENGNVNQQLLARYDQLYGYFSGTTRRGFAEIQAALEQGAKIDFGDSTVALDNAKSFINDVKTKAQEAIQAEEDAYNAIAWSVQDQKAKNKQKLIMGYISPIEYLKRAQNFDQVLEVARQYRDEQIDDLKDTVNQAYDVVFDQALSDPSLIYDYNYWEYVINPLLKEMQGLGYHVPPMIMEAMSDGITDGMRDLPTNKNPLDQYALQFKFIEEAARGFNANRVANDIKERVRQSFSRAYEMGTLDERYKSIIDIYGINNFTGMEFLSNDAKKEILARAKTVWNDPTFIQQIADELGYEGNPIDIEVPVRLAPRFEEDNTARDIVDTAWFVINPIGSIYQLIGEQAAGMEHFNILDAWSAFQNFASYESNPAFVLENNLMPNVGMGPFEPGYRDKLRELLRNKIVDAMQDFEIDPYERNALIFAYGEDLYNEIIQEFIDAGLYRDSGSLMNRMNQMGAQHIVAMNGASDVNWTPKSTDISTPATAQESDAELERIFQAGTQRGTENMLSILRDILITTQSINRKNFTVNITPSSGLGAVMTRGLDMYGKVTG